jgi:hypothetical protein
MTPDREARMRAAIQHVADLRMQVVMATSEIPRRRTGLPPCWCGLRPVIEPYGAEGQRIGCTGEPLEGECHELWLYREACETTRAFYMRWRTLAEKWSPQ